MARASGEGYEHLGQPKLGLADAVAQSAGFMAPVFSAALLIPLIAGFSATGEGAGIATPLAVIVAAVGVAALGWIIAAYARRIHAAGSIYDYVTHGFGERVGFLAGWLYYVGTAALAGGVPLLFGGLLQDFLKAEFDIGIPYWALSLAYCALLFFVLFSGARISTRLQLILVLFSALVVLIFFVNVILQVGDGNSLRPFSPGESPNGVTGILFGVLYGVLIFIGFETAANLGEETADPAHSIPRAIFLAIGLVSIYYVLAAYAQVVGFGLDVKAFISSPAPLFQLGAPSEAGGYGSVLVGRLLQIVVILDIAAVGLGASVSTSRGIFALARDRRLPRALAKVASRHGTPWASIALTVAIQIVFVVWARLAHGVLPEVIPGAEYFPLFVWLAGFGGFALVVVYAALSLGALKGLWHEESRPKLVLSAILGFAISAGAIFGSIYQVPHPANKIPLVALIAFLVGVLLSFAMKGRTMASKTMPEVREANTAPGNVRTGDTL
jgi:amino acid transporter